MLRIGAACSHVPDITADPNRPQPPTTDIVNSVRYNPTSASDANRGQGVCAQTAVKAAFCAHNRQGTGAARTAWSAADGVIAGQCLGDGSRAGAITPSSGK